MFNPVATYRIQFHKEFSFSDLKNSLPYLRQLGIGTIYASPVFKAVPGSMHGYDGLDPNQINPEIGTEEQLRSISQHLRHSGIGWLQDIVPNHMAFHPHNEWLMDVLEKGQQSEFTTYFDINWNHPATKGKLMVPVLGTSVEEAIANGDLKLNTQNEKICLQYFDNNFPLNDSSQKIIDATLPAGQSLSEAYLARINKDKALLTQILNAQHYQLCHWQDTDHTINYRRFFTINGLICVNIQDPLVFGDYHRLIGKLVKEDVFQGLRIDHIDGLYDPTAYLDKLKDQLGSETYVVVEKILHKDEQLPSYWAVEGSSGYDFLALVNNLLTNKEALPEFNSFYEDLTGDTTPLPEQVTGKKAYILHTHMAGELENLTQLFLHLELATPHTVSKEQLKEAIAELLIACPVYRFYGNRFPLEPAEKAALEHIFTTITAQKPGLADTINLLRSVLITNPSEISTGDNEKLAHFYRRCMQFSGPLMAKGVEDTLMYTYNRFIGHNDVGDSPESFGCSVMDFHQRMITRQEQWPLSINTTSTHDTKRGEDARARLNVLTDLSTEWLRKVSDWRKLNAGLKTMNAPDANDEYFIYQTIVGAYPLNPEEETGFLERLHTYLEKALREAKTHSGWTQPDTNYEQAVMDFARSILSPDAPFRKSLLTFLGQITDPGIVNSLTQLILKFTCPGVPDIYQGTELWDLSLVDPDNRRPVDYTRRQEILSEIAAVENKQELLQHLWQHRKNGHIKLWLTHQLLQERSNHPKLFSDGLYIPLQTEGIYKDNILAFARRQGHHWLTVIVPLNIARLCSRQKKTITSLDWKNTRVVLRPDMPAFCTSLLNGKSDRFKDTIPIKEVFTGLPFALLSCCPARNDRAAGVLLPIFSLPAPFGIGDLGPAAKDFVRSLCNARQKYWQILPLNPTEAGAGHSPYSSYSAMAGNPLLISPELLVADGLLQADNLKTEKLPLKPGVEYEEAEQAKRRLFDKAFHKFRNGSFRTLKRAFDRFRSTEAWWLNDMALYTALREYSDGRPWYEWDEPYKNRRPEDLEDFSRDHHLEITKIQWLQFIFLRQWKQLRKYANVRGIQLFGDMPFYVSYDSVDVWARRELFCLDADGDMTGIAGVPPDYFSEDGQLWGMPTFNWKKLEEEDYEWWALRLKKNLELFDLLRIDHFRAFEEYWQVPAGETTARNGVWLPGPREKFFEVMERKLGKLPFVAEDLGDRMEAVYALRDKINLPGMKVLQFAWGENMPASVDIPHNFQQNTIVYTGTHDNNTTIGWYREETNRADHHRMHHYLGLKVRRKNIHEILARVAYASVARIAILPMQDILGLDQTTRMNTPGTASGNWLWRLKPGQMNETIESMLRDWVETYNRF